MFFLILPLANSVFDYFSLQVSRWFTKKATEARSVGEVGLDVFLDLLFAVVCLLLLVWLIPAVLETFSMILTTFFDAEPIEWKAWAKTARDFPFSQGLGVTLMLFSTLLPTLAHLVITFAIFVLMPVGGGRMAKWLSASDISIRSVAERSVAPASYGWKRVGASIYLTFHIVLSCFFVFVLPVLLYGWFVDFPLARLLYGWMSLVFPD